MIADLWIRVDVPDWDAAIVAVHAAARAVGRPLFARAYEQDGLLQKDPPAFHAPRVKEHRDDCPLTKALSHPSDECTCSPPLPQHAPAECGEVSAAGFGRPIVMCKKTGKHRDHSGRLPNGQVLLWR